MKISILFDSYFGNTEQIAQAIGNALNKNNDVEVLRISEISWQKVSDADFLIVGSPTRGFRPSENTTNFLKNIPAKGLEETKVAAFDTRILLSSLKSKPLRFIVKTGGYAAKHIAKSLKKNGGSLILSLEGFLVSGEEGPLVEGELKRAAKWAEKIIIL